MNHIVRLVVALALVVVPLSVAGCSPKVEVRTGTKVICTYGEVISDDVRVVKVPAEEAGQYKVETVTRTCERHAALAKLYREAQEAIAAGDLQIARAKLQQVVGSEAGFGRAQSQLNEIDAGKKPQPDATPAPGNPATTPTEKPGESPSGSPAESLLSWAPDAVEGFTARKPAVDPLNVAREYTPASGSDIVSFVIVAEQFSSAEMAGAGMTVQLKDRYTKDKVTKKVNGHNVYFGTDGRRFSAAGFVQGSVMVMLEMSGKSGADPKNLQDDLEKAIGQLP